MFKLYFSAALIVSIAYYIGSVYFTDQNVDVPRLPDTNWGPSNKAKDSSIRPFKINIPQDVIDDLNDRLSRTRELVPPLEKAAWTYGISNNYFKKIINYWRNKYNWQERQDLLNKYPQYITTIQGLDIHFYHIKPNKLNNNAGKVKVLPLLLLHGWPGSIVEFQKIIPMLTSPQPGRNFVFEVIAPSLPGYGFSDGAVRTGLATPQMAVIFKNLMERLGFKQFYAQGGDWGSFIVSNLAVLYPERIVGAHMNMCPMGNKPSIWLWIGAWFPSLVVEPEHQSKVYPLMSHFGRILEESGYMHLQATKPDTAGVALLDSPAGLAAYIIEKFSTWTNPEYRFKEDGGLLEKYHMDELLDNVMIYWVTRSITTSFRLYAENFGPNYGLLDAFHLKVPTACAIFPYELVYTPESLVRTHIKNLVQFNHMPRGGHFAAFEEPELLSDDLYAFVEKVEQLNVSKNTNK